MNESLKPRLPAILCLLLGLLLAGCSAPAEPPPLKGATIGGPFTLTDQNGRPATERNFAGRWRIFYFGFSHCPDACPTDLAAVAAGLRRFEKEEAGRAAKVVPVFVSVDPERDTPPVLKEYVAAFHPRMVGLTGTPQQVADTAKRYGIYYVKAEGARRDYNMDHSRYAILFGPDGAPIAQLPTDQGAEAVARELDRWVK
ncbi:MAG TPA: SCO family protein [Allosphingosinicella sp.]|nr:SCO family protein [Allosphingosinicella sp.]